MTPPQAAQILATVTALYLREFSDAEAQVWARCLAPLEYRVVMARAESMPLVHEYPRLRALLADDDGTGGHPRTLGGAFDPEHDRWQLRQLELAPGARQRERAATTAALDRLLAAGIDWDAHLLHIHRHLEAIDRRWPAIEWAALSDHDLRRNALTCFRLIESLQIEAHCGACPDPRTCRDGKAVVADVRLRTDPAGHLRLWYRSTNCLRRQPPVTGGS